MAAVAAAFSNAAIERFVLDDYSSLPVPHRPGDSLLRAALRAFRDDPWLPHRAGIDPYRPLTTATLYLDEALWGRTPLAFHVTSIGLHALASVLLCFTLRALTGARSWAAPLAAAAVFAVHPLHTEAVASAYNRSEVLATLGVLAALGLIARHAPRPPPRVWAGALGLYAVSLLFKESAATLPVLAGAYLALRAPGTWRQRVAAGAPALGGLAALALYGALRAASRYPLPPRPATLLDADAALQSLALLRDGLRWTLWPDPLCVFRPDYAVGSVVTAVAAIAALGGAAWWLRRRLPVAAFGLVFYVVALLPSTPLVTRLANAQVAAERYLYLPSVGLAIALCAGLEVALQRRRPAAVLASVAVLCALLGALTRARNAEWRDGVTLLTANAEAQPASGRALMLLLRNLEYYGGPAAVAQACLTRGRDPRMQDAELFTRCADVLEARGQVAEADGFRRRAMAAGGSEVATYMLARSLARRGQVAEADALYRRAIAAMVDPARRRAFTAEWLLKCHPERLDEALREADAALALDPDNAVARDARRRISAALGRP